MTESSVRLTLDVGEFRSLVVRTSAMDSYLGRSRMRDAACSLKARVGGVPYGCLRSTLQQMLKDAEIWLESGVSVGRERLINEGIRESLDRLCKRM